MLARRRSALLALVALVALLVLGAAAPAGAHATLVSTDPAEGAVLPEAPDEITLTFDEAVRGVPDGVQVFDAAGASVDSSSAVSDAALTLTLDEEVEQGTLVVVWRVASQDGHAITGSLSFSVGEPSTSVVRPPVSADGAGGATDAPWLLSLARWVGYVGLLLTAGLVAFATLFLRSAPVGDRPRARLITTARSAAAAATVAWLSGVPITATYLVGDAGGLGRGSTWSALPATEYAVAGSVVAGLLVAVVLLGSGSPPRARAVVATVAAVVAVCAPSLTGHTRAATPEVLAVAADAFHLLVGSVWLGGLVGLALVLPDLAARGTAGAEVLARFSGVAAGLLAVLVGTGAVLTWRIVGSWSALVDTGYGVLLLVKGGVALVAMGVAAWNRFALLPRLRDATKRRDRRSGAGLVARATGAEAGVLVAVLLVTGLLVDRSPEEATPVAAADPSQPVARTASLGEIDVRATLATQAVGPNTVTIELLDAEGRPTEGYEAPRPSLAADDVDLGAVEVVSVAPGTYEADVVIPSPGSWRLQVSLRTSEFDNPVTSVDFTVSAG